MDVRSPHRRTDFAAREPEPTWVSQQHSLADRDDVEHRKAVRALMGACVLGALDHIGPKDLRRWGIGDRSKVTLSQLRVAFLRRDTGLHGCGFEYAVDAAINGSPTIPTRVRDTVVTAVSGQVQLLLRDLGVPTDGWSTGLRSVMYGVERRGRPDRMAALEADLGPQALLWSRTGADPVRLLDVLPLARCPGLSVSGTKRRRVVQTAALPDHLHDLWKTDLLLGGASVLPTESVRTVVGDPPYATTAWVAASLKYPFGKVTAGAGLHLGIETTYDAPKRRVDGAMVRQVRGMPVLTLPLDGDFVRAFNYANGTLGLVMRNRLTRKLHPATATNAYTEQLGNWLGARRTQLAVDVARELLDADCGLFTVRGRASVDALESVASHTAEDVPRPRPLAPIPLERAS